MNNESPKIDNFLRRKITRKFEKTTLVAQAQIELQKLKRQQIQRKLPTCIYDVFDMAEDATLNHGYYLRPKHLDSYIQCMEKCTTEEMEIVLHSPSQMGKSTATLISLLYHCLVGTDFKAVYITYNDDQTLKVKSRFIMLLDMMGIEYYKDAGSICFVNKNNPMPNSVYFTSVGGTITGGQFNLICIDDYIKGGDDSIKAGNEEKIYNWWKAVVVSRRAKSQIIIATRQSNTDLSGKLIDGHNFKYIRLPAICDGANDPNGRALGEPLNPDMCDLEEIEKLRNMVGERIFELQYQGNAVHTGATPIKQIVKYIEGFSKQEPLLYSYGIDLAYSGTKKSDYCAIVCVETNRRTGNSNITRCMRRQCLYRDFIVDVQNFTKSQPGNIYFCAGGYEEETSGEDFRKVFGGRMVITTATRNKYTRLSQSGAVTAFEEGWLQLPAIQNIDMNVLEEQLLTFSGADLGPGTDDFVDAVSAAYNSVKNIRNNLVKPLPSKTQHQKQFERQHKHKALIGYGRRNQNL